MLVLLSLLAALGFAQDCNVPDDFNPSQKRRECKKRTDCKWSSAHEDNGVLVEGTCAAATTCESLNSNQCKKRNNCYINDSKDGKPCEDYDETQSYPCAELNGKKNFKKCKDQPNCINGSGDRQQKLCLTMPSNLQDRDCREYNGKPNKYVCKMMEKCTWQAKEKLCALKRKPDVLNCGSIDDEEECNKSPGGCAFRNGSCRQLACNEIDGRFKCNMSERGCTWYEGFHATDFDITKNKRDQKDDNKDTLGARDGTCKAGVNSCDDIMIENHCLLARVKFGLNDCYWNSEAKEMGRPRCSTRRPCGDMLNQQDCVRQNNMFNNNCVWQLSGDNDRCMEFDCTDDRLDTKNKCNTVGCHWHRNKDKRDPLSEGFCGVKDNSKGRRL